MYKTIGIVGGMGPAATADLMKKITDMTDADCDQEHIHLLIDSNVNIPDRTAAILHGGEDPVPELLAASKRLESIGADFLIMPCNTAHWFIPALESEVGIPFLNMPVETARLLKRWTLRQQQCWLQMAPCRAASMRKLFARRASRLYIRMMSSRRQ